MCRRTIYCTEVKVLFSEVPAMLFILTSKHIISILFLFCVTITAQKHTYPPLGNLLGMQMETY